ncbi:MAG: S8 family serine peptidase, partial [candidate division WOR-3 bacterium]
MINQKKFFLLIFGLVFCLWSQELDYVPGEMLVQFKNECRGLISITEKNGIALCGIPAIDELNRQWQISQIKKVILDPSPDTIAQRMGLDLLYHFTFPKATDIEKIIMAYRALPYVKYACPNLIYQVNRIPNDSLYSSQWHLPNIGCPQAWDASTGDTSVVTAIIDMGVDYNHIDAQANLWINPEEDINHNGRFDPDDLNGVDEDNNGYVDDVIGYDFLYGDPDPMPTTSADDHGMHCWGIASAVTDNSTGVASVGYRVRGMALKCGEGSAIYLYPAIAAIYYAADNGAWVISMSYGSYRGQNDAESTALAYAWERGLVEVAGAGNDNVQTLHYPAAYSWVIAVAASNANNVKADFSNYGTWIDICAPGVNILSTIIGDRYAAYDGTSMACPVVAGVCALVKSAFPEMTNAECTTRIFQSCDSMPDPLYRSGLLGYGRVNVAKAVLQPIRSNLRVTDFRFNDQSGNNNGIPEPGETVALIITLTNEISWQSANDITALIANDDPEIEILKNSASFPNIPAGGSGNCSADSFVLRISASSPPYRARFDITLTANPPTVNPQQQLICVIGLPRVLLVDDDDGANLENWYTS